VSDLVVGAARVRMIVPGSRSLKDKRQVVRSIKDRLPNTFPVAVAEIADLNDRRSTVIGISAIGNDGKHVLSVLEKTVGKLRMHPEAQLVNHEIELFRM
jgi:uncharacterized protein YlxP (DUF503 family)